MRTVDGGVPLYRVVTVSGQWTVYFFFTILSTDRFNYGFGGHDASESTIFAKLQTYIPHQ